MNEEKLVICPGCGKSEQLEILDTTFDFPQFLILCRPCQFSANGETKEEAIINWNNRIEIDNKFTWVQLWRQ